jgi:hypothetical protein
MNLVPSDHVEQAIPDRNQPHSPHRLPFLQIANLIQFCLKDGIQPIEVGGKLDPWVISEYCILDGGRTKGRRFQ